MTCLGLAYTSTSRADTFCVLPSAEQSSACSGPPSAGLQVALDAARDRPDFDRVLIGPGTFSDGPFCYTSDYPIEIIGAPETVLTMTRPAEPCTPKFPPVPGLNGLPSAVLTVSNGGLSYVAFTGGALPPHHVVSNLGIEMPPSVENEAGMVLEGAFANKVDVTANSGAVYARAPTGVVTQGIDASFTSGSIGLSIDGSVGLRAESIETLITRSQITALTGVFNKGISLFGVYNPRIQIYSSVVAIADAQPTSDAPAVGLLVFGKQAGLPGGCPGGPGDEFGSILLAAGNVTVYGSGRNADIGVELRTETGTAGTVLMKSSVLDNVGVSVAREAAGGFACILNKYSSHSAPVVNDLTGSGIIDEPELVTGPPKFVSPEAGDFHLRSDSPLIDQGDQDPVNRLEPPLDADPIGKPRILDGKIAPDDTECEARRDVGAFEFDPMTVLARASVTPEAVAGRAVQFEASASCAANPHAVLSGTWSFDDGGTAAGVRVLHTFTTPGVHHATVVVESSEGYHSSAIATVLVRSPAGDGAGPAGEPPVTAKDTKAPRARRLDVRPRAFRAAGAGASIARSTGAFVRYRLSEPAKMRFTVQRIKHRRSGRERFTRLRGSFTNQGRKDSNKFRFTGRLAQKKLRPGRYRLVGVPADSTGNRGAAVRARFRIARR